MTDYTKLVAAVRDTDFVDTCVYCEHSDMCKDADCIILQAADAIEALQAQLPKRGKWIKHEDDACECSVCGLGLESFVEGIFYNFCPFCGADMRAKMEVQDDKA